MPISFSSTRANNQAREYVSLGASVDGDMLVIFKDQLEAFDIKYLDYIEDNTAGSDLLQKITDTDLELPNNQTPLEYFTIFFRGLVRAVSNSAIDDIQTARGAVGDALTVGVRSDRPHVFASFKFFDSADYDNEVTATGGTISVTGMPVGASGYFEIFGSPLTASDASDYAEQGSSLESVRGTPSSITGATHYLMTVIAFGQDN